MRDMRALVAAACGAVLLCSLCSSPAGSELFAPLASSADLRSPLAGSPVPVYLPESAAPAFQPVQPTGTGQNNAAAFLAGAAVLAAVCCRTRVPSAVAMAAVDGREDELSSVLSRRAMFAALAASPVLAATAANAAWVGEADPAYGAKGAKPIWAKRKGNKKNLPQSVQNGCKVDKACAKGAVFPLSNESAAVSKKIEDAALSKFKARQPPEPES